MSHIDALNNLYRLDVNSHALESDSIASSGSTSPETVSGAAATAFSGPQNDDDEHMHDSTSAKTPSLRESDSGHRIADGEPESMQDAEDLVDGDLARQLASDLQRRGSWALRETGLETTGNTTFLWGRGDMGQLGSGGNEDRFTPYQPDALKNKQIVYASANFYNSVFILDDGDLLICGNNDNHQLGFVPRELRRSDSMSEGESSSVFLSTPQRIGALEAFAVHSAAVGSAHAVAVVAEGSLAAWGCNEFGQLGLQEQGDDVRHPRLVRRAALAKPFVRVAAGEDHTLALTSGGAVLSTGNNAFGQLGHSQAESLSAFKEIEALWSLGIIQVSCGATHSAALTADGRLYTWGRGKYGQLGIGEFTNSSSPRYVDLNANVVQVASGGDHTLAVTAEGEVYSWGLGAQGQLGHGDAANSAIPRRISSMAEHKVLQVSAGSQHSLLLTDAGKVWTFGSNAHGQLGLGDNVECSYSPQQISSSDLPVAPSFVLAAGEHCICLCASSGKRQNQGLMQRGLFLPCLKNLAQTASGDPHQRAMLRSAVVDIIENPGYLAANLTVPGFDPRANELQLDCSKIQEMYVNLLKVGDQQLVAFCTSSCGAAAERIRSSYEASVSGRRTAVTDERLLLRALVILFQNPVNPEAAGRSTMRRIIRALALMLRTSSISAEIYKSWLRSLPSETFRGRILKPLQRHLSFVAIRQSTTASRDELLEALAVLEKLYAANEQASPGLPVTDFENLELSEGLNLTREYSEYRKWMDEKAKTAGQRDLRSVCQVSFCLNPQAKSKVLQIEAAWEKQNAAQQGSLEAMLMGQHPAFHQFLIVLVRREALMQDALTEISRQAQHLKRPLRVIFMSGGVQEEGVDQGGVTKEFFQLLMKQLFEQDYGMFVLDEETRNFWFNFKAVDALDEFRLVGWLVGLAVYNNVILDIHFPPIVYKKLNLQTHEEMAYQDLLLSFPSLGRGLQKLLDFEGDVESTFAHTFEVEYDYFGELRSHPLKPGGRDIPINNSNRKEYVDLFTKWLLHDSVEKQFNAFARGFREVCAGPALKMFRSDELELLICGLPDLNFEDLQAVARYEGGYNQEHPTIKCLWQCLHTFSLEQKKLFLKFTTGCDRAPIGGLGNLELIIQRSGPDTDKLPTSHTCFNYLLLPEYSDPEKLKSKLVTAINNAEGFGLQ